MYTQHTETKEITDLIVTAAEKARQETDGEPEPGLTKPIQWPVECTVGPGLEGAIACETKIGYVNGTKGWLIYRGYDIFDLCAYSTFEEVSYLLLHGQLPTAAQLEQFKGKLALYRYIPRTLRHLQSFPVEIMNTMAALRLGMLLMRQKLTYADQDTHRRSTETAIGSDEDSIPMETAPTGEPHAIYEFPDGDEANKFDECYHLIAGAGTVTAAIARLRTGRLPIEPDPALSHAGNLLYMMTGEKPDPVAERIMDVALILHADHGMTASTFASMVVASTLSDIYFSIGAGIAALNGPLHGGANEQVLRVLNEIGTPERAPAWYEQARSEKRKIMGFGHRVYKAYDPRARVLAPLAEYLAKGHPKGRDLYATARVLEEQVVETLGKEKKIFPNVDFYSGIVYTCMGIPQELFTPLFAVSRVSGWTARVVEYLENNRIFRPRGMYTGAFDRKYTPLSDRG